MTGGGLKAVVTVCTLAWVVTLSATSPFSQNEVKRGDVQTCHKVKKSGCGWITLHQNMTPDIFHKSKNKFKACKDPKCICAFDRKCHIDKANPPMYIFECMDKVTRDPCNKQERHHKKAVHNNKKVNRPPKKVKKARKHRNKRNVRQRPDEEEELPAVLSKIMARHRKETPQSFGRGTFILNGFSHVDRRTSLMNRANAHSVGTKISHSIKIASLKSVHLQKGKTRNGQNPPNTTEPSTEKATTEAPSDNSTSSTSAKL